MPIFDYVATDSAGQRTKGQMEAKDRVTAINSLRKSQLIIIAIKESKERVMASKKKSKVKLEDLVLFSRQLSALVKAGIPLVRSLNILFAQVENPSLKEIITSVLGKIESGSSLSEALSVYPHVFSALYINMIKAGEFSGALDSILERLSIYLEETSRFNRKVRSAFMYPSIVMTVAMLITSVIFLFVIPGFKGIFTTLGADLPLPTQILITLSDILKKYFFYLVGLIGIIVVILKKALNTPRARLKMDKVQLRLPVMGRLVRKVIVARFSRTLSTLLKSGVSILSALEIGSKTAGNKIVEIALDKVMGKVSKGERIGDSLAENKLFPPLVVNLISVGEETGDLASMLDKVAGFYEEEVDTEVSNLTSLIEPFIIVFLGVVIGGIVLAMFLPILQITKVVGK